MTGYSKKLIKYGDKDVRISSFTDKIVVKWNNFPNNVLCARNIQFKMLFDNLNIAGRSSKFSSPSCLEKTR